ncbi:MAG: helicase HerA-like domain-containing protein [Pseudomonadota bacterium]
MPLQSQHSSAASLLDPARTAEVLEQSITWEDDVWKRDLFDVDQVHRDARQKFATLLGEVAGGRQVSARMLLFHGQSGAGKTHLIRALRCSTHRTGVGYFGYAQMTPDVTNYAEYFLRRLVNALEKPYDPDTQGESGLHRLADLLVAPDVLDDADALDQLREADLDSIALARLVTAMADQVVASPAFVDAELDINIVRALLYLHRADPRVDQRVRQYFYGRQLNEMSSETVAALDPNEGQDRAFEIIESLGKLMHAAGQASLVFCIDQVEDLRFYDDAEDRFQRAIRDLIQIANRVPSAIIVISILGDFYNEVRSFLPQSFIDRIEKAGPVLLRDARDRSEAEQIVGRRLRSAMRDGQHTDDPAALATTVFGGEFFSDIAGLSTRKMLEATQQRWRVMQGEEGGLTDGPMFGAEAEAAAKAAMADSPVAQSEPMSAGHPPLRVVASDSSPLPPGTDAGALSDHWDRLSLSYHAEIPDEEEELADVLLSAFRLAAIEAGDAFQVETINLGDLEGVHALDLAVTFPGGETVRNRIFLCNKGSQGGALKRQIERVLHLAEGHAPIVVRTSEFPPNGKNATTQLVRRYQMTGGRKLVIPSYEWDRMMTLGAFHSQQQRHPEFVSWLRDTRMLHDLPAMKQLLGLDLPHAKSAREPAGPASNTVDVRGDAEEKSPPRVAGEMLVPVDWAGDYVEDEHFARVPVDDEGQPISADQFAIGSEIGDEDDDLSADSLPDPTPASDAEEKPDPFIDDNERFQIGGRLDQSSTPIALSKSIFRRHAAMLGGSGSGKTTLAISVIEQLLLRGIPAILIDRKGDLCSYANPDVWRPVEGETAERRGLREELGSSIDVAVYTPGRTSGRPIGITLLPNGIAELPEHEQQQLANVSAAALGDMLHLKKSATHQRQGGVLAVALKLLGSQSLSAVTLADLIYMLENDDAELIEMTQRMDPSGKLRRDLIGQLDSLRHRNWALFEGGGEQLRMESLLGLGKFARPGRTRLSVVYTGFLGDNENILFWVSQFLSEALRFSQRNPNEELQAVIMFDEADLYIPANAKPATSEPLQSLLKRARSAGIGMLLATQSPGDLDYKSRDQITSWFIGRVREDTALKKLKAAFGTESGLDPARVLPNQTVGEFHLIQEAVVHPMKAKRALINAEQVPFDKIEQLARETHGQEAKQLKLEL